MPHSPDDVTKIEKAYYSKESAKVECPQTLGYQLLFEGSKRMAGPDAMEKWK